MKYQTVIKTVMLYLLEETVPRWVTCSARSRKEKKIAFKGDFEKIESDKRQQICYLFCQLLPFRHHWLSHRESAIEIMKPCSNKMAAEKIQVSENLGITQSYFSIKVMERIFLSGAIAAFSLSALGCGYFYVLWTSTKAKYISAKKKKGEAVDYNDPRFRDTRYLGVGSLMFTLIFTILAFISYYRYSYLIRNYCNKAIWPNTKNGLIDEWGGVEDKGRNIFPYNLGANNYSQGKQLIHARNWAYYSRFEIRRVSETKYPFWVLNSFDVFDPVRNGDYHYPNF